MRIGFDAKRAFYNRSGLGNYSRDTILSLLKYFPDNDYYLYTPRKKKCIKFLPENNPVHIVRPKGVSSLYQSYWRSISLGSKISKDKLDLYHGLSNELPANIVHAGTKRIVTIHDLIFMRYPELYHTVDREIYQQKFFEASLAADKIIAISKQTKDDIISFFHIPEDKIHVIYQGCNPMFYEARSQEENNSICKKYHLPEQFLLSVGTIERRKNAIHILESLISAKIDVPIVFVGKPTNYLKELSTYIRLNGLEKNVIFLHDVPSLDLPSIYQSASIFIYPSMFEGFGIPILEALNSGTPVITNKYGCFIEAGGDAAFYVNPNHPEEIGEAILKTLNDKILSMEMKNKGLIYANNFKQKNIANDLMNLYKSILEL
jgi:glycosyltransferase involved in cell wall biosynthesis